tara:strand:+ start:542 stop:766 length:225 start_codon:yes stop_codon:yes gene_type:complete
MAGLGALENIQGSIDGVQRVDYTPPMNLNEFLKLLPDDMPLTVDNVANAIRKISNDDLQFYLLKELSERYPGRK